MAATGESTIAEHGEKQPVRFFCSWFCPFAQRAWIALEEKGVHYQYTEIMPYKADSTKAGGFSKNPLSIAEKTEKYPDFVACSPKGLVPGIEYSREDGTVDRIYESLVCIEYIDEAFEGPPLLPEKSPALRAHCKVWVAFVGDNVIPHFYRMLMKPTAEEREEEKRSLLSGLEKFAQAMAPVGPGTGAFFLGDAFSFVDIAVCPWWQRFFSIGTTYRDLEIPRTGAFARLHAWGEACDQRQSVARTLADQKRLIDNYSGYADGTGTSTVAKTLANM